MARKPVSYPADYKNDRSVRREHRAGVTIVLILLSLCALSCATGGVLLAVHGNTFKEAFPPIRIPFDPPHESFEPNPFLPIHPEDDTLPPDDRDVPQQTPDKETEASPKPSETNSPNSSLLDPNFMDDAAQPFAERFETLPDVIDAVAPGVVGVINLQRRDQNRRGRLVEWGSGSGFLITTDGYILTNQHVIEGAHKITVRLHSGEEYDASLIGADKTSDTAVLKIDAEGLTALPKGDSDTLRVGEFVLAIGDPVDSSLGGSVTFGIISATSRSVTIEGFTNDYLQTDAAINLGNSGGPLIDSRGFVIGMNSAKTITAGYDNYGNAIAAEGIGFALPINKVWQIATQLITTGRAPRPGIGITIRQYNADYAEEGDEVRPYVDSVTPNGPAAKAGLKEKDVILAVDGKEVVDYSEVVRYIREHTQIGQELVFTIERDGTTMEIKVIVGDLNQIS